MPRAVRRGSPGRHHHALSGNGGQKVYLVPSLDLIVVFTGSSFNVESPVNEMMVRVLLPALIEAGATVQRRSGHGPSGPASLLSPAGARRRPL